MFCRCFVHSTFLQEKTKNTQMRGSPHAGRSLSRENLSPHTCVCRVWTVEKCTASVVLEKDVKIVHGTAIILEKIHWILVPNNINVLKENVVAEHECHLDTIDLFEVIYLLVAVATTASLENSSGI